MKLSKTPLALALALAFATPTAMAHVATDNPKHHTPEVEETGRHAQAERPDVMLLTKVKAKLAMDDSISALDINVDVEDSVVSLRGTVETQAQADEAVRLARDTVGVDSVRSHLVVNPRATDEQKERNMESPDSERHDRDRTSLDRHSSRHNDHQDRDSQRRNTDDAQRPDAMLLTKIKAKLAASDSISALDINVDVEDSVVSLRGIVDNQAQADEAARLARETVGVNTVRSHLVVDSGNHNESRSMMIGVPADRTQDAERATRNDLTNETSQRQVDRNADGQMDRPIERPDAWVLTKVKAQMLASDTVGALDINVDVDDGVATLTGEVATQAEAREAERIAGGTEGVKRVKSNLRVVGD